jgi:hypothetical protein
MNAFALGGNRLVGPQSGICQPKQNSQRSAKQELHNGCPTNRLRRGPEEPDDNNRYDDDLEERQPARKRPGGLANASLLYVARVIAVWIHWEFPSLPAYFFLTSRTHARASRICLQHGEQVPDESHQSFPDMSLGVLLIRA